MCGVLETGVLVCVYKKTAYRFNICINKFILLNKRCFVFYMKIFETYVECLKITVAVLYVAEISHVNNK